MSTLELSIASLPAGIEKAKPTKPPTFACWRVANADTDVSDVLLHWHPDLPQQLPSNQDLFFLGHLT